MAPISPLKRSIAYDEEEIEATRKKLREIGIARTGVEDVPAGAELNERGNGANRQEAGGRNGQGEEIMNSADNDMRVD